MYDFDMVVRSIPYLRVTQLDILLVRLLNDPDCSTDDFTLIARLIEWRRSYLRLNFPDLFREPEYDFDV